MQPGIGASKGRRRGGRFRGDFGDAMESVGTEICNIVQLFLANGILILYFINKIFNLKQILIGLILNKTLKLKHNNLK